MSFHESYTHADVHVCALIFLRKKLFSPSSIFLSPGDFTSVAHLYMYYIENTRFFSSSCSGLCSYKLGQLAGRCLSLFCSYRHTTAALWVEAASSEAIFLLSHCASLPSPCCSSAHQQTCNPAASAGGAASWVCWHFHPLAESLLSADA